MVFMALKDQYLTLVLHEVAFFCGRFLLDFAWKKTMFFSRIPPRPAQTLPVKLVSEHVAEAGVCTRAGRAQPISGRVPPTLCRLFTTNRAR